MKILKIRRGYTTNSSAASEFIPPDAEVVVLTPQSGAAAGKSPLAAAAPEAKPGPDAAKPGQAANKKPASPRPTVIPIKPMPAPAPAAGSMPTPSQDAPQPPPTQDAISAPPQAAPAAAVTKTAAAPKSRGENNSILLGALAALVAAAFAVERLLRRVMRKRKNADQED